MNKNDKTNKSLYPLGWDTFFQNHLDEINAPDGSPARVTGVQKNHFLIRAGRDEILAKTAGRLAYRHDGAYPVTGDWVLAEGGIITRVLPRKNILARTAAGSRKDARPGREQPGREQPIAANLDHVLILCGMDRDFNLRRMERYLTLVYNCGLNPVIVLTKTDLHGNPDALVREAEAIAFGVPVHGISSKTGNGIDGLDTYLHPGRTIALIGSSGAGKSTLINRLYGEDLQPTSDISAAVGKGTHTTTSRSLIVMPRGGMIIDNPGIREIGLQKGDSGLDGAFPEIDALAGLCRFQDCSHIHEPGCAVRRAITGGTLHQDRLDSFLKMKRELDYLSDRQQKSADRIEKERWKGVSLKIKAINKRR